VGCLCVRLPLSSYAPLRFAASSWTAAFSRLCHGLRVSLSCFLAAFDHSDGWIWFSCFDPFRDELLNDSTRYLNCYRVELYLFIHLILNV
jgi:drug/metabolite transporter (DMT)-like permease